VVFGAEGLGMCLALLGSVNGISASIAHSIAFRSCSFTFFLMGIGFSGVLGSILGQFSDFVIPLLGDL